MTSQLAGAQIPSGSTLSRRLGTVGLRVVTYAVLTTAGLLAIFPFYYMILAGFMAQHELVSMKPIWFPKTIKWDNYVQLFAQVPYFENAFNSVFVAVAHTVLVLFFCSLAAFAFAKLPFPGKGPLFMFLLLTMMLPSQLTLVPLYIEMLAFKWIDTYWPLVIPGMANAFGIFLMRQYTSSSVSNELLDAAKIDGCSTFGMYRRIVMPIVIPGLAALGLLTFVGTWNSFLWPLIVLNSERMFTLPLTLVKFSGWAEQDAQLCVLLAGCTLATLPLVVVFLFSQKYFMGGLMSGALKG